MKKRVNFRYESIANLVRLLITIQFEKLRSDRDIAVFHERFDGENDDIFESFLTDLFPNGTTIGEQEINQLVDYVSDFMRRRDKLSKDLYVKYDKSHWESYVYFKIDNEVKYASLGDHCEIVTEICCDYFKGFDEIDIDYLKMFILENFEVKSDFTTVEMISEQADYIASVISFHNEYREDI